MTKYETTVVLDSFLKEEEKTNLLTKIQNFIKNNGGEIHQVEEWGKKRLAYEINRKQYGIYVHILFSGPGSLPKLLEREFRLEEAILRYLTVKFDEKLAKWREMEEEKKARAAADATPPTATQSKEENPEDKPTEANEESAPAKAEAELSEKE